MKEELQSKLVEVIDSIQTTVGKAGEFALAQLPAIAQEYVAYGRARSAILVVFLLALSAVLLKLAHWAYRNPWNSSNYSHERHHKRSESNFAAMYLGGGVGLVLLIVAVTSFDYLVWFAPKVWLLKQLAMLVK